ncbi:MAG: exodeoxyribonuclease VII large subunit, partial [Anaerolineae bacterium]
ARSLWRASPQYGLAMSGHTVDALTARLRHSQEARLAARRQAVAELAGRLRLVAPAVEGRRAQMAGAAAALFVAMATRLRLVEANVRSTAGRLDALDPTATLARGYAIVKRRDLFESVVTSARSLERGAPIHVQFADGAVAADVVGSPRVTERNRATERGAVAPRHLPDEESENR